MWQAEPLINWTLERLARRVEMVVIVHLCIDRYPTWMFFPDFFSRLFSHASSTDRSINASTYQMTKISHSAIGSEWKIQITEKDLFVNRGRARWISPFKGIERTIEWWKGVDIVWNKNLCRWKKNIEKSFCWVFGRIRAAAIHPHIYQWLMFGFCYCCVMSRNMFICLFTGDSQVKPNTCWRWRDVYSSMARPGLIPCCYSLVVDLGKLPLRFIDVHVTGWASKLVQAVSRKATKGNQFFTVCCFNSIEEFMHHFDIHLGILFNFLMCFEAVVKASVSMLARERWVEHIWKPGEFKVGKWIMINIVLRTVAVHFITHASPICDQDHRHWWELPNIINYTWVERQTGM